MLRNAVSTALMTLHDATEKTFAHSDSRLLAGSLSRDRLQGMGRATREAVTSRGLYLLGTHFGTCAGDRLVDRPALARIRIVTHNSDKLAAYV